MYIHKQGRTLPETIAEINPTRATARISVYISIPYRLLYNDTMSPESNKRRQHATWRDYQTWPEDWRWQIVDGQPYAMTAAPLIRHQRLITRLNCHLQNHLDGGPCEVFPAPTALKLSEEDVVQPDLMVVCDPNQIRASHVDGPPALIIEVLSPSTEQLDRGRKLDLYASSGVREVWLVTPYPALIEIFELNGPAYQRTRSLTPDQSFRSDSFPDLALDLNALFDFPIPPEDRIDIIKEPPAPYCASQG